MATLDRLYRFWVYGGALAALPLAALIPLLAENWSLPMLLVYAHLPIYMLHQLEEHDDDSFRRFFNKSLGRGYEALTPFAVFLINVPGVWGVIISSLYLAIYVSPGFGMIAAYLVVINAVVHILQAVALRAYNPGLGTAALVFLPVGMVTLLVLTPTTPTPLVWHLVGLAAAIAIHAAIMVHVKLRLRRLAGTKPVRAF